MQKKVRALLLLVCLSLITAVPSHAALVSVVDGWSWAEVYASVLEWFGLGEAVEKAAPAPPPPDDPNTTTMDGGCSVDPNGCPKPKP